MSERPLVARRRASRWSPAPARGLGRGVRARARGGRARRVLASRARPTSSTRRSRRSSRGGRRRARARGRRRPTSAQVAAAVDARWRLGDLRVLVNARRGPTARARRATTRSRTGTRCSPSTCAATFLACRAVGASLLRRGAPGAIVTMSSQMGAVGYPGRAAYCADQARGRGPDEGARRSSGRRDGIRVNAVAPTFVETPMTGQIPRRPGRSARRCSSDGCRRARLATVERGRRRGALPRLRRVGQRHRATCCAWTAAGPPGRSAGPTTGTSTRRRRRGRLTTPNPVINDLVSVGVVAADYTGARPSA